MGATEQVVKDGAVWARQTDRRLEGNQFTVKFQSAKPLHSALLISTVDTGFTGHRSWTESPAELLQAGAGGEWLVGASVPSKSTAWFINVRSGGLTVSSGYEQAAAPNHG